MMKVKLKRDGRYGKKGSVIEITDGEGKRMIDDGVASEVAEGSRKTVKNKAMTAKG